jgi:DNA-binding transcriptional ArsR family regulator
MVDKAIEALRRLGRGTRGVEDAVSYSLGHRIRIEIQAALHEGPATASRLAAIVRRLPSTVDHHIKEMLNDGSIDIARTEKVGNLDVHYYCMVKLPYYSDEDVAAMTEEERQALAGLILQASMAEALASLWAGKMINDPRVMLAWNRINLDKQGREELADEEAESWCRRHEIEARSANRRAETGEEGITYVIISLGFERSRTSAPEPLDDDSRAPGEGPQGGDSPTSGSG